MGTVQNKTCGQYHLKKQQEVKVATVASQHTHDCDITAHPPVSRMKNNGAEFVEIVPVILRNSKLIF